MSFLKWASGDIESQVSKALHGLPKLSPSRNGPAIPAIQPSLGAQGFGYSRNRTTNPSSCSPSKSTPQFAIRSHTASSYPCSFARDTQQPHTTVEGLSSY